MHPKNLPISLTSSLLKALERLINAHIKQTLGEGLLLNAQHAYTKGKSVDTALHYVEWKIESALENRQLASVIFLNILYLERSKMFLNSL